MNGCATVCATVYGPAKREKKLERKRKNLIRLGVARGQAYAWSRTRMGGWAVAQSPILGTTITLSRLRRKGYSSMLDYYLQTQPQIQ
jgi:RNA-directed DNA polymerase